MEIVKNEKGFKVLKLTTREARHAGMGTTEGCICMHCNGICGTVYYVAVLNDCMCESCFNKWINSKDTINYPEDREYELRSFNYYLDKFKND